MFGYINQHFETYIKYSIPSEDQTVYAFYCCSDENKLSLYLCLKDETFLLSLMLVSIEFHSLTPL